MGIFDKFIEELPEEYRQLKSPLAIFLADRLDLSRVFWGLVLMRPTPASFNSAGGLAVRQFVELVLPQLGPRKAIGIIGKLLADPNSTWKDLGLSQVNDATIGQPLSLQNKADLLQILEESAFQFLSMATNEIIFHLGHIQYEYGYGYLPTDVLQQNFSFGYGFKTQYPDYYTLIAAFEQEAQDAVIPSFFLT